MTTAAPAASASRDPSDAGRRRDTGMLLGLLGVIVFSATLPMTRLAVADLHPLFIAFGRAAVAGVAAALLLALRRPAWPTTRQWRLLAETALGVVVGFPVFSSIAMKTLPAAHGAIVIGLMPLATAMAAVLFARERPSVGFWLCALVGTALVTAYASSESGGITAGDWALLAAVALGALGYARGGLLSRDMDGDLVISWTLVLSLPVTVAVSLWSIAGGWAAEVALRDVSAAAWLGFAYVSLFSMWIGFFFWYRGLAIGGVARVGQIQLLQPFFTVLIAALLLGETLDAKTLGFAAAVIATVAIGRRTRVSS